MVFFVAIPMTIGPPLGAWVVKTFGEPTVLNAQPGFIPPQHIFLVNAVITLLALLPLAIILKHECIRHQLYKKTV